ncbi:MAG: PAS domain-containing protein [bacterium]|nr:PAS domain-containing protein [bacterium]
MFKTISNKIILSFSILILLLVLFLLVFFNDMVKDTHLNILKREMGEKTRFIELVLQQDPDYLQNVEEIKKVVNLRVTIVDNSEAEKGAVIADSDIEDVSRMDNHQYRVEIKNASMNGTGDSIRYSNTFNSDMLYFARASGSIIIRLAKPLQEIDKSLRKVRNLILFFGAMIFVISIIVTVLISKKITGSIDETLNFAEQFSEGDYSKRILNYSEDEMGHLQKSLNKLADIIVEKIDSLVLEQSKLEITIDSIHDGIAVVDNEKKIILANQAFTTLLSIAPPGIGSTYYEVIRNSSFNSKIEYAIENGEKNQFEEEFLTGVSCEVFIRPIKEENTIQGILIVVHDITEKKKIDRVKTELVGNLSHELKTPITILKGYLETIINHLDKPDLCKDFIGKAVINLDRQNSIINDMLTLNMLETSKYFSMEEVSIKEVIGNCVSLLETKAQNKGIAFSIFLDPIDDSFMCNKFLTEAIFFNIIDNAINYNIENGEVKIIAEITNGGKTISISDSGIGIPPEAAEKIFERFYRVDKSRSRDTGGTGLGLSIVKHSAELQGWNIRINPQNKGTSFLVEL